MTEKSPGSYETVPLRSDEIRVCIIQSWVMTNPEDPEKGKQDNVNHMLKLVDIAQTSTMRGHLDLIVFHEFPIGGFDPNWNREQLLRDAVIEIPGKETEAIGQKAKEHNCYIHFGCYGKLADWPGHFMNMGIIVGPGGDIVYQRWKMRNLAGFGFSTTVYDVLDEYVKRYGWNAVFPIARTDIGNLAVIPEVGDPELARAYGIKGTEIMIRYMTGAGAGYSRLGLQAACRASQYYGLYVNNALHYVDGIEVDIGAGGSAIISPMGSIVEEATSNNETLVTGTIPIADYRAKHTIPEIPKDLFQHVYEEYVPRYPANSFLKSLPNSMADGIRHYKSVANW